MYASDLVNDMDAPAEAKRKLAWMFAPTPPLTKKVHGDTSEISVDIPSRLGKKGAAFLCLQPRFATMHTFAEQGMTVSCSILHFLRGHSSHSWLFGLCCLGEQDFFPNLCISHMSCASC